MMLASSGAFADQTERSCGPLPRCNEAPRAWLGLRVSKPDETTTAQVPSLPPGVGFVVDAVDAGGPAELAGLRELDLLWKLGDQMLVNEAQLAALLRLATPGDEVSLHGFRGGQALEVKLTLGVAPPKRHPLGGGLAEAAIQPGACPGPMRVVHVSEKVASITAAEGTASVRRDGSSYQVRIDGPAAERVFHGTLTPEAGFEVLPGEWRGKVQVLCRTLDQAIADESASGRVPRPRVVSTPALSR